MALICTDNKKCQITAHGKGIYRVSIYRDERQMSLLEKYSLIDIPKECEFEKNEQDGTRVKLSLGDESLCIDTDTLRLTLKYRAEELALSLGAPLGGGFDVEIALDGSERLFGLGDESRESINKRGRSASIWQANVITYGPIPFMVSSRGWGIFVNSTYRQEYDLGKTDADRIKMTADEGGFDIFLFTSDSVMGVISKYAEITGKPALLPKSAYGFTYVTNEETNARTLLEDCARFRSIDFPCDIMGLEPGWMEKYYDFSLDKDWSYDRFWMPYGRFSPKPGNAGSSTMFSNLRLMNFKFSLWLCCDYDLLWEEEREAFSAKDNSYDGAEFEDAHFKGSKRLDTLTRSGEPWFRHLEKFVDNGAFAFKLDGANQVLEHPDRMWAGRYTDREVHNVYPVIYAKQMKEGFERHTGGRRAMIYTPSLYAGTQKYAATWAGDTGGGPKSMVSILNLALCGHSNASCDMSVGNAEGVHFGFLTPWAQLNNWRYWFYPWLMGKERESLLRRYSKLRSAIIPYIYSMAYKAHVTGVPMARPMCISTDDEALWDAKNIYMLGDSLLVLAFDMRVTLPHGRWLDLLSGEYYDGGRELEYTPPKGFGGGLFLKAGGILVSNPPKDAVDIDPEMYTVNVTRGGSSEFELIEDDGVTYAYLDGHILKTKMTLANDEKTLKFVLSERSGSYPETNYKEYDAFSMSENHKNNVKPAPSLCPFVITVNSETAPKTVTLNGESVYPCYENGKFSVNISRQMHEAGDVTLIAEF